MIVAEQCKGGVPPPVDHVFRIVARGVYRPNDVAHGLAKLSRACRYKVQPRSEAALLGDFGYDCDFRQPRPEIVMQVSREVRPNTFEG